MANLNKSEQLCLNNIEEVINNTSDLVNFNPVSQEKVGKELAKEFNDEEIFALLDILLFAIRKTPAEFNDKMLK